MVLDPVCDMKVDESRARWLSTYEGQDYYFCCAGCKKAFDLAPVKYVKGEAIPKTEDSTHLVGG